MKVGFLRDLLATLPDDMDVMVNWRHVDFVSKDSQRNWPVSVGREEPCGADGCHGKRIYETRTIGPTLTLGSTIFERLRGDEPREPRFRGRWSRASREVIDRHSSDPDAKEGQGT